MSGAEPSPAELRSMFGRNLRILARRHKSVSDLARRLDINRTQLNRYLAGESFPRPDVLARICAFFGVDARVLMEPVERIDRRGRILGGPVLADFAGAGVSNVTQSIFPSGFYRFARAGFRDDGLFVIGLILVFRDQDHTYLRGYDAHPAGRRRRSSPGAREFRGYVTRQDDGVALVISRRNSLNSTFSHLARSTAAQASVWVGFVTRAQRESHTGRRVVRIVAEHLGPFSATVLDVARQSGMVPSAALPPLHRRLLRITSPFR